MKYIIGGILFLFYILFFLNVPGDHENFAVTWIIMAVLMPLSFYLFNQGWTIIFPQGLMFYEILRFPISKIGILAIIDLVSFFLMVQNWFPKLPYIMVGIISFLLTVVILMGTRIIQIKLRGFKDAEIPEDF